MWLVALPSLWRCLWRVVGDSPDSACRDDAQWSCSVTHEALTFRPPTVNVRQRVLISSLVYAGVHHSLPRHRLSKSAHSD
jgi:hypothetical protein